MGFPSFSFRFEAPRHSAHHQWHARLLTTVDNCLLAFPGYACPVYSRTGRVTEGGEVYSFGMVMLELLTGLAPATADASRSPECTSRLIQHGYTCYHVLIKKRKGKEKEMQTIQPYLVRICMMFMCLL